MKLKTGGDSGGLLLIYDEKADRQAGRQVVIELAVQHAFRHSFTEFHNLFSDTSEPCFLLQLPRHLDL